MMVYIKVEYYALSRTYLFTLPQEHRLAFSQVKFSWLALLFDHGLTVIFWFILHEARYSQFQSLRVHSLCCVDQYFGTKLNEMRSALLVKCGYSTNLIDLSNWWCLMTPSEVTSAIKLKMLPRSTKIYFTEKQNTIRMAGFICLLCRKNMHGKKHGSWRIVFLVTEYLWIGGTTIFRESWIQPFSVSVLLFLRVMKLFFKLCLELGFLIRIRSEMILPKIFYIAIEYIAYGRSI